MRPTVDDALAAAGHLRSLGASRGAGTVAFNALCRSVGEGRARLTLWTPDGPLPFPADDVARSPMASTIA